METKHILTSGIIAVSLIAAPVAFADSDRGTRGEDNGLHLGGIVRLLDERGSDNRRDNDRKGENRIKVDGSAKFYGTVTSVSGSTIMLKTYNGTVYTVNAANAEFDNTTLAQIAVGDTLKVEGALSGTLITATEVKEKNHTIKKSFDRITGGVVTAITGSTITLDGFGKKGTTTVSTNASTVYSVNGTTATSGALTVGSTVFVAGTTTAANPSFTATVILVLKDGLLNVLNLFR